MGRLPLFEFPAEIWRKILYWKIRAEDMDFFDHKKRFKDTVRELGWGNSFTDQDMMFAPLSFHGYYVYAVSKAAPYWRISEHKADTLMCYAIGLRSVFKRKGSKLIAYKWWCTQTFSGPHWSLRKERSFEISKPFSFPPEIWRQILKWKIIAEDSIKNDHRVNFKETLDALESSNAKCDDMNCPATLNAPYVKHCKIERVGFLVIGKSVLPTNEDIELWRMSVRINVEMDEYCSRCQVRWNCALGKRCHYRKFVYQPKGCHKYVRIVAGDLDPVVQVSKDLKLHARLVFKEGRSLNTYYP